MSIFDEEEAYETEDFSSLDMVDDYYDEEAYEDLEEGRSEIEKSFDYSDAKNTQRYFKALKSPIYNMNDSTVNNYLEFIKSIPKIEIMNAETLVAALIFKNEFMILNEENFSKYIKKIKDKNVNKFDLLKYIHYLDTL
jgi:hypothetical protein